MTKLGQIINKRIPLYLTLLALVLSSSTGYIIGHRLSGPSKVEPSVQPSVAVVSDPGCKYKLPRLQGFSFTKPLVNVEPECEDEGHESLKNQISALLENYKSQGSISSASVYFRDLYDEGWIAIGGDDKFYPASLLKVPAMITALRLYESNPLYLEKKIAFNGEANSSNIHPFFPSRQLEAGRKYTVRELMEFMITYSDNNSVELLLNDVGLAELNKTYTDLGLAPQDPSAGYYTISSKDYSKFFSALYNASYLNIRNSDYALSLLSKSDFKQGIVAGIPGTIQVSHKFGEGFAIGGGEFQLHETGIIYLGDQSYLLTVMTKGKDMMELTRVIGLVSKLAYESQAGATAIN